MELQMICLQEFQSPYKDANDDDHKHVVSNEDKGTLLLITNNIIL